MKSEADHDDEGYRPEVVAELLKGHERDVKVAEARERRRLFTPGRRAMKWLGGAALVIGLSGMGLWSTPRKSAEAAPPPRIELPEVVVVASAAPPEAAPTPPKPEASTAVLPDGRIVLNVAAEDDLTKLPSVGPSRAKAIVALRAKLGKFRQLSELLRVKGIGRKTLAKIAPKAVLDAPVDAR